AVRTMAEVAESAETTFVSQDLELRLGSDDDERFAWAIAHAAVEAAEDLDAAAIVSVTVAGSTPRRVAAHRPTVPIAALSGTSECLGALALCWGVQPLRVEESPESGDAGEEAERAVGAARDAGVVSTGDLVVVVAGSPGPRAGATDFMRVMRA
ncbi:MAG: pyruvate kinase, partial [Actinomycetota bacterium]|nr:pyruvate kinase [Actinomycetota bacterium]